MRVPFLAFERRCGVGISPEEIVDSIARWLECLASARTMSLTGIASCALLCPFKVQLARARQDEGGQEHEDDKEKE
jgi:hypothetical protein